ncbi:MAG: hypothetical protein V1833_04240 [Elusimicrobiota bacterium]
MITSNLARKGHPSRIFVDIHMELGQQAGLLGDSVIMTDNVATVRVDEIYKQIGKFTELDLLSVAIKHTFGI